MAFSEKIRKSGSGSGAGRGPLSKTVRLRPDSGGKGISITMSGDVLPRIPANIGSHIEVILGSEDDYGSFLLKGAKPSPPDTFKVNRRGDSSVAGLIHVRASQLFDLKIPKEQYIDCALTFTADGVICAIPQLMARKLKAV